MTIQEHELNEEERRIKEALGTMQELSEPSPFVKKQLDRAWKSQHTPKGVFQRKIPLYQSAAAIALFLLAGIGIGNRTEKPDKIVAKTVVKCVEKPVYIEKPVHIIRYIRIPAEAASQQLEAVKTPTATDDTALIAASDSNHVDYSKGMSLADDTLLQRMMVTLY